MPRRHRPQPTLPAWPVQPTTAGQCRRCRGRMNQPRSSGRTPKATSQPRSHMRGKSESIRMRWMPSNQCDTTASMVCHTPNPMRAFENRSRSAAGSPNSVRVRHSSHNPDGSDCIHQRVKQAVGQNLEAEVRVGDHLRGPNEQVMPLQRPLNAGRMSVEKNRPMANPEAYPAQ